MLTDVVFGGDVEFLGLVTGFMPLLDGGFPEVLGFFGGDVFDLGGLLGGAFLQRGGLFRGGAGEFAGLSVAAARRSWAAWPTEGARVKPASGSRGLELE